MSDLPHEPSGMSCLVAHFDKDGHQLPSCDQCRHCGAWIRYGKIGEPCPKRREE